MNLFEILKDINLIKSYSLHNEDDFEKEYNDFMINRYLSMSPETVFEANFMNTFNNIPKSAKYLFLSDIVEKKNRFLKYIKNNDCEDAKLLTCLQELYNINKSESMMISKTITDEEKKRVVKYYEDAKRTIRKR